MDTMLLKLPEVKAETERRPTACRYCGCQVLQGWGRCRKPVRDSQLREVQARRYRCTGCERTFRHYPEGISQADQSTRMVQLAALMWALGLSLRQATMILAAFGVTLQRMSIWRDAQVIAARLGACRRGQIVPCIGVDGTWVSLKGRKQGLGCRGRYGEWATPRARGGGREGTAGCSRVAERPGPGCGR